MAKIGTLQVGTEKIMNAAISAVILTQATDNRLGRNGGTWTSLLVVANPAGLPIQVFFGFHINFPGNASASGTSYSATLTLKKGDGTTLFSLSYGPKSGTSRTTDDPNAQTIDMSAGASETYTLLLTYTVNDGGHPLGVPDAPVITGYNMFTIVTKK